LTFGIFTATQDHVAKFIDVKMKNAGEDQGKVQHIVGIVPASITND